MKESHNKYQQATASHKQKTTNTGFTPKLLLSAPLQNDSCPDVEMEMEMQLQMQDLETNDVCNSDPAHPLESTSSEEQSNLRQDFVIFLLSMWIEDNI